MRGLFVIALIFFLKVAEPLLAPVTMAVMLTFVLAPGVRALRRRGVPEVLGAGLLVGVLLASTVPVALSLAEPAAIWWQRGPNALENLLSRFDHLRASIPGLAPAPARPAAGHPDPVKDQLASQGLALTGALLGRGVSFALSAASTVILLYFLLASEHWMLSRCVEAVPRRRIRAVIICGLRAAQREIAAYIFSLALINLGVSIAMSLALHSLGMPHPVLWGVIAGVLNFVPYVGPLLIVVLLLLAGSLSFTGWSDIVAPALSFVAVHAVESNFIGPWVVGRRLLLSPISVFLSVMFWGWLWGIAGAMTAVPILIGVRSVCRRNRRLKAVCVYLDGNRRPPPSLRSLLRGRRLLAQNL